MAKIERFEEIKGWQAGRELCKSQQEFDTIYAKTAETSRMISGFISYLQQHPDR